MIEYIKGTVSELTHDHAVIECNGIAYFLHISLQTREKIGAPEALMLYTHLSIKEDSHTLFGFADKAERALFRLLISVSGIGPSTARVALSALNADELSTAIMMEDEVAFKKIKGIGPKTAKRIILDLKDKIAKGDGVLSTASSAKTASDPRLEAISALTTLGFSKGEAAKAVNKIVKDAGTASSVEDLIRKALQAAKG